MARSDDRDKGPALVSRRALRASVSEAALDACVRTDAAEPEQDQAPLAPEAAGLHPKPVASSIRAIEHEAERGQPDQARGPPATDNAITVYTVKETAKILKIGLTVAYAQIANGQIPAIKIGGTWLVPRVALVRLLARAGESSLVA